MKCAIWMRTDCWKHVKTNLLENEMRNTDADGLLEASEVAMNDWNLTENLIVGFSV